MRDIGRFHTRRRTNRLDGQIVSDEQIVWCANGTNKSSDICPSGGTIFPTRIARRDEQVDDSTT